MKRSSRESLPEADRPKHATPAGGDSNTEQQSFDLSHHGHRHHHHHNANFQRSMTTKEYHSQMNLPHRHGSRSPVGASNSPMPFKKVIKYTEVTFKLRCNTKFGDQVVMVGVLHMLGAGDPQKGAKLSTTEATYPEWTIKIDLPRDKIIEYKYLIVKNADQGRKSTI